MGTLYSAISVVCTVSTGQGLVEGQLLADLQPGGIHVRICGRKIIHGYAEVLAIPDKVSPL